MSRARLTGFSHRSSYRAISRGSGLFVFSNGIQIDT
jgi:hypothetical protein